MTCPSSRTFIVRNLKIVNSLPLNPFRRCEKITGPGLPTHQHANDEEKRCQRDEQSARQHQIQSSLQSKLSRRQGRSLKLDREVSGQSCPGRRSTVHADPVAARPGSGRICRRSHIKLRRRSSFHCNASSTQSTLLERVNCIASSITRRPFRIAGFFERRQQISPNLPSDAGLLQKACLRESHHRIAITDSSCPIASDHSPRQSILESGGNPKMEPEQQHQSEHAEARDRSARKIGTGLGQEEEQGQAQKRSDETNMTDRTRPRAETMALGP